MEHRRADLHLKHRKFLEAIECHKKAYDYLGEALTCTSHAHAIESISEQRKYHLQQTKLVAIKKEQFENCKRALESRPRTNSTGNGEFENAQESDSASLQVAIYRNMEEADYLLDSLIKGGIRGNSDSESLKSFSTTDTDDKIASIENLENGGIVVGNKHPKSDSTVIEELRTLNDQLRSLVYRLVMQLDASKREVDTLKERIKQLETEKGKGTWILLKCGPPLFSFLLEIRRHPVFVSCIKHCIYFQIVILSFGVSIYLMKYLHFA